MNRRRPWIDRDQGRAAALSLLIHALAVLGLAVWIDVGRPPPPPEDTYLLLELGTPDAADQVAAAPADDATAQTAPDPGVVADAPGQPTPGEPAADTVTAGDPAQLPEDAGTPTEPQAAVEPGPAPAPAARAPASVAPAPSPRVAVAVPEIEVPEIDARPLPDALPLPPVSAVPTAGAVALPGAVPDVRATARTLPTPDAGVRTSSARSLAAPQASASAPEARAVALPSPTAAVPSGERALAAPEVLAAAAPGARDVAVDPAASVRAVRRLPTPSVQAAVRPVAPDDGPGAAAAVPDDGAVVGGDAVSPGQEAGDPSAPAAAVGRATDVSPEGDGGAQAATPTRLREVRPSPIAVVLDNALGYPQSGLPQASWIAEMPVEGGLTRLMAFFDAGEPARVGPVRSARDYLVEVAGRADAVIVHVGGSPGAMFALSQGIAPSLDAYTSGDLFERVADRSAPYDLYSAGASLRDAIQTMRVDANRLLTGFRPLPPGEDMARADTVSIDWSGAYRSGFRYLPAQDRYRWIRSGEDAVSADGTAVQVEAVLIARIEARPIPGDPAGRLYVPIVGGDALLLWRGTAQAGRWSVDGGLRFTDAAGNQVALETLVTWAAFVPTSAQVDIGP